MRRGVIVFGRPEGHLARIDDAATNETEVPEGQVLLHANTSRMQEERLDPVGYHATASKVVYLTLRVASRSKTLLEKSRRLRQAASRS